MASAQYLPHNARYLPELELEGLSADALVALADWLRPLIDQFDTANTRFGWPFIKQSEEMPGCIEDTAIGGVVAAIGNWAVVQHRRVLDQLTLTPAKYQDEHDLRAAMLLADAVIDGEWAKSRALFDWLEAEAQVLARGEDE